VWASKGERVINKTDTPQELQETFPLVDTSQRSLYTHFPDPETVEELQRRVKEYVRLFEAAETFEEGKRIVLVSHAATSIILIQELLRQPDFNEPISVCSKTVLFKANEGDGWHLRSEPGSSTHLSGGVSFPWNFPPSPAASSTIV